MFFKLNFEQYVPVQHLLTEDYYAFLVTDNKDFDAASDTDLYVCYPVLSDGEINTQLTFRYPKKELQIIYIPL
ncbi:hypothetical protein AHMF7605_03330 [Adhaeribacter arboris]|uniref:Uncharacterized protein n=1 Tax=Adhaeribacter arboris TaxID=2072846 RepID=A0A2T2YAU9_9BACT|nr:hypothetical protein [Adhaeribacter arboris]PSR52623.1 hypothetical protein AHMF7605_03330 [Adhaeribacter arboris]